MVKSDNLQEYPEVSEEELEREESVWVGILLWTGKVFVAIVLVAGLLYIYGGLREFFMFQETPRQARQQESSAILDAETVTLPLNIIVLRHDTRGSKRDMENIQKMVGEASKVWAQGSIGFNIEDVHEMEVSADEVDAFLSSPHEFVRSASGYDPGMINVFLTRRLAGINGISFGGLNTVAVADLTTVYDFRVLAHEIGHVFGLEHVAGDRGRLMYQGANGFDLTLDEARRARKVAGDFLNDDF